MAAKATLERALQALVGPFDIVLSHLHVSILAMEESINTTSEEYGIVGHRDRPDYMNERVFQRNRLPPRAYFLPAEQLSLSGKWRFRYASSPLDAEPDLVDDDAWDLIDVPGKLVSSLFRFSYSQSIEREKASERCLSSVLQRRITSHQ